MTKYSAYGTQIKRGSTAIAQVKTISGPGISLDTEEVTSHDSTNGWEELIGTILRSGEVGLDLIYDPNDATHKYAAGGLIHDLVSRVAQTYNLVFPTDPVVTWTFDALVTKFEPTAPVDGALTASATLKITGEPTLA